MSEKMRHKISVDFVKTCDLPEIPSKIYFTIGEVSTLCEVKTHVVRYWEVEFPALSPVRRRGNRRYYQRKDIALIRQIRELLYDQGYTIEGARSQLKKKKKKSQVVLKKSNVLQRIKRELEQVVVDLQD